MSRYYAHVKPDLTIDQIVVVADADVHNLPFPDSEPLGQAFLHDLYGTNDQWLETSMTGEFRGRPASIGGIWIPELQEFGPVPEPAPEPEPDDDDLEDP
jgi:hypothetical protein